MKNRKKIILVYGPTASGKSKIAIDICKKFNGEILNADSMQVYKELKILSARPEKKSNIKHHFYGFLSPKKSFLLANGIKWFQKKLKKFKKEKKFLL